MDSIGKARSDKNSLVQNEGSGKAGAGSGVSDQDSPFAVIHAAAPPRVSAGSAGAIISPLAGKSAAVTPGRSHEKTTTASSSMLDRLVDGPALEFATGLYAGAKSIRCPEWQSSARNSAVRLNYYIPELRKIPKTWMFGADASLAEMRNAAHGASLQRNEITESVRRRLDKKGLAASVAMKSEGAKFEVLEKHYMKKLGLQPGAALYTHMIKAAGRPCSIVTLTSWIYVAADKIFTHSIRPANWTSKVLIGTHVWAGVRKTDATGDAKKHPQSELIHVGAAVAGAEVGARGVTKASAHAAKHATSLLAHCFPKSSRLGKVICPILTLSGGLGGGVAGSWASTAFVGSGSSS